MDLRQALSLSRQASVYAVIYCKRAQKRHCGYSRTRSNNPIP
jgi:hypothetical protein